MRRAVEMLAGCTLALACSDTLSSKPGEPASGDTTRRDAEATGSIEHPCAGSH